MSDAISIPESVVLPLLWVLLLLSPVCCAIGLAMKGKCPCWVLVASLPTPLAAALWYHGLTRAYMLVAIAVVVVALVSRLWPSRLTPVLALVGLAMPAIPAIVTFFALLPYLLGAPSN
jgi:hypothetical protein